jgi:DNA-binding XRE family transcriptional regulator
MARVPLTSSAADPAPEGCVRGQIMARPVFLRLEGSEYVMMARNEYERLVALSRIGELPPLPARDRRGKVPAAVYARASIAREIIRRRAAAGLTQRELARIAGVRVETLCRIETGKHTASTPTIAKLEHALTRATKGGHSRRKGA